MKADKGILKSVADAITMKFAKLHREYALCMGRIRGAETVEQAMEAKKTLLDIWLRTFPISSEGCYFCIKNDYGNGCKECEYGKVHGACTYALDSTYYKICNAHGALRKAIEDYFRPGETYPDPEPRCEKCGQVLPTQTVEKIHWLKPGEGLADMCGSQGGCNVRQDT